jgi:hypothetical protein
LDTEWLLSTLFDASLLSTFKAAGNGGSFLRHANPAGNHIRHCHVPRLDSRPRARNDLFIIKKAA